MNCLKQNLTEILIFKRSFTEKKNEYLYIVISQLSYLWRKGRGHRRWNCVPLESKIPNLNWDKKGIKWIYLFYVNISLCVCVDLKCKYLDFFELREHSKTGQVH